MIPTFVRTILSSSRLLLKLQQLCFLSLYIVINVSASYQTNLIPPDELPAVLANPSEVHNRIIGSIMVIPLEQSMLFCIWGVKTCIWLFLKRLW
jgi:hypothetical protein